MPRLAPYDQLAETLATRADINRRRAELETAPIRIGDYWLECDPQSERRMLEAIDVFEDLGVNTLAWTMADNRTVPLNRTELRELYRHLKKSRAQRSMTLHRKAQAFKARLPEVTLRDVMSEPWL